MLRLLNSVSPQKPTIQRKTDGRTTPATAGPVTLQPFITESATLALFVVTSDEGKAQLLPGIREFNAAKVQNAAMVVVFATVDQLDEQHLAAVHSQETKDGRFKDQASGDANDNGRRQYVAAFTGNEQYQRHWLERQAYISLGFLLLGAASLG